MRILLKTVSALENDPNWIPITENEYGDECVGFKHRDCTFEFEDTEEFYTLLGKTVTVKKELYIIIGSGKLLYEGKDYLFHPDLVEEIVVRKKRS
jgi:hypothetical protein